MNNDDDMAITMGEFSDIGSQHYQWTGDIDLADDLAHYFILAYEHHVKMTTGNNSISIEEDDDDLLFLNYWDMQDIEPCVDWEDIINRNPMGLVTIDANQPSSLQSQLVPINQQQSPLTKSKVLKRVSSLRESHPSSSSSKPLPTKSAKKKSKPIRLLQPKDPNL